MRLQDFSGISAAFTIFCLIAGAIIALWQTRKITHERLQGAVKDLQAANDAKAELTAVLEDRVHRLQNDLTTTILRVGEAEQRNDRRIRRIVQLEEHRDLLIAALERAGLPIPSEPRP